MRLIEALKLPLDERGQRRAAARAEWFAASGKPLEVHDLLADRLAAALARELARPLRPAADHGHLRARTRIGRPSDTPPWPMIATIKTTDVRPRASDAGCDLRAPRSTRSWPRSKGSARDRSRASAAG